MIGNELLNGISTVYEAINAFNTLKEDVVDYDSLQYETARIITMLCQNNPALNQNGISQENSVFCDLGEVKVPFPDSVIVSHSLNNKLSQFVQNNSLVVPIGLNLNQNFAVILEVDQYSEIMSSITEKILFSALENKNTLNFRCADVVKGGSFFKAAHNLVTSLPEKSSGKVYKSAIDFNNLLKQLEETSAVNISKLVNLHNSVIEYNSKKDVKLK